MIRCLRRGRAATGLIALAAVGGLGGLALTGCTASSTPRSAATVTVTASAPVTATPTPSKSTVAPVVTKPKPKPLGKPVAVSSLEGDGQTYGVGMPLIIRFSVSPTDKKAFEAAAKVTVDGVPAGGAWYWEKPFADSPTEVHYRQQSYWKAHSKIHVDLPVNTLSAWAGLSFANNLTLDYSIGAYHYSRVDAATLKMSVYNDGKLIKTIPVSLGKGATPTYNGTKVVMQKDNPVRMVGAGYDELVADSVRLTNSGEYIHAAPWNSRIGQASTSNGCTNLDVADAAWFYGFAQLGDVVQYPNANPTGQTMPSWDGYGDWNVVWTVYQAGGAV